MKPDIVFLQDVDRRAKPAPAIELLIGYPEHSTRAAETTAEHIGNLPTFASGPRQNVERVDTRWPRLLGASTGTRDVHDPARRSRALRGGT